jgi:zinc protease
VSADVPFTEKNQLLASIAGQVLSARLVKIVREDEGAVYSISASGREENLSETPVLIQSVFPMKPEMKDKVLAIIAAQMEDMTSNISTVELNKVKEYMVKESTANLKKNGALLSAMMSYDIVPVDVLNNAVATINSITEADVAAFMDQVMKQNNYRVFILDPEAAAE